MGGKRLGLILQIQLHQLSNNLTWSAATTSSSDEHIVCSMQDENRLLINSVENCTSTCWVSWGFCLPSTGLCPGFCIEGLIFGVSATFPTLIWSINSVSSSRLRMKISDGIRPYVDFLMFRLLLSTSWIWSDWFLLFKHSCQDDFEYVSI